MIDSQQPDIDPLSLQKEGNATPGPFTVPDTPPIPAHQPPVQQERENRSVPPTDSQSGDGYAPSVPSVENAPVNFMSTSYSPTVGQEPPQGISSPGFASPPPSPPSTTPYYNQDPSYPAKIAVEPPSFPPPPQMRKDFCKIGFALIGFTVIIQVVALVASLILTQIGTATGSVSVTLSLVLNALVIYGVGAPCLYLFVRNIPRDTAPIGAPWKPTAFQIFELVAISRAAGLVGSIASSVFSFFFEFFSGFTPGNSMGFLFENPSKIALFFFLVILGPIVEELIFRKMLLSRLTPYGERFAMVTTALFFGLFHINFEQLVYAYLLGIILAYVAIRTQKIIYPIILHMIFNFMGFLSMVLLLEGDFDSWRTLLSAGVLGWVALALVVLGIVFFLVQFRNITLYPNRLGIKETSVYKTFFGDVGVILALVLYFILHVIAL